MKHPNIYIGTRYASLYLLHNNDRPCRLHIFQWVIDLRMLTSTGNLYRVSILQLVGIADFLCTIVDINGYNGTVPAPPPPPPPAPPIPPGGIPALKHTSTNSSPTDEPVSQLAAAIQMTKLKKAAPKVSIHQSVTARQFC